MEWVWFSELRCSHLFRAVLVLSLSETSRSCSSRLSQMPFTLYFIFWSGLYLPETSQVMPPRVAVLAVVSPKCTGMGSRLLQMKSYQTSGLFLLDKNLSWPPKTGLSLPVLFIPSGSSASELIALHNSISGQAKLRLPDLWLFPDLRLPR